jgi:hypothetical protein
MEEVAVGWYVAQFGEAKKAYRILVRKIRRKWEENNGCILDQ